jgi:hypothetical protein
MPKWHHVANSLRLTTLVVTQHIQIKWYKKSFHALGVLIHVVLFFFCNQKSVCFFIILLAKVVLKYISYSLVKLKSIYNTLLPVLKRCCYFVFLSVFLFLKRKILFFFFILYKNRITLCFVLCSISLTSCVSLKYQTILIYIFFA